MDPLAPVAPAPEGVTPDFHKFTALQLRLSIIFGVTFTIATVLLGLRLYTAIALVKRLSWDACEPATAALAPTPSILTDCHSVSLLVMVS